MLGEEHPNYATSLSNLGRLYKAIGDYTQAEAYHRRSQAIRKKIFGQQTPRLCRQPQ